MLFFETQTLPVNEIPHRAVADDDATFTELHDQATQREVGLARHARKYPFALPGEQNRTLAAHRFGRRRASRAEPLRPLHNARNTDTERIGNDAARQAVADGANNTLTKIERVRSNHAGWPPLQPAW